jgi:ATP-binding cassette subfamily B protein
MKDKKTEQNNKQTNQQSLEPSHGGMKKFGKPKDFKSSFKKLFSYTEQHRKQLITAIIFSVLAAMLVVIGPLFLGKITDKLHYSMNTGELLDLKYIGNIGIILVICYILSLVFNYIQGFIIGGVSNKIAKKFRTQINEKINTLPLKYFDKVSVGDTLSRITNDVDIISSTLSQNLSTFIISFVRLVAIVAIMFVISWQLALIAIISLPLTMFLTSFFIKKSRKYFTKQQQILGEVSGFAEESYSAHNLIKVFDVEENMIKDFDEKNSKLAGATFKAAFYSGLMQPTASFVSSLTYLAVAIVGTSLMFKGVILVGAITSFVLYVRQLGRPIAQIVSTVGTFQSALAASERVFEILEEDSEEQEKNKKLVFKDKKIKGNVEFKSITFGYDEEKPVINNFSFTAKAGEKIAIVGPTGAGKTTIINLLMRFYEVSEGQILVDGVDTKTMKRQEVRSLFGMVLQDSWLFEASIEENLRYGAKNLSFKQIEDNCKKLNIDHFIKALPQGYDTIIDEASNLSQGQKQLITIARASLQNAPMLILDEATSSVDTRAEMLIQKAMDSLSKNKTNFVIAHRLSTIKNANQIIVMDSGSIVEVGNHETLFEKGGNYAQLYLSQFEEVEND